jgi:hypothetical protein
MGEATGRVIRSLGAATAAAALAALLAACGGGRATPPPESVHQLLGAVTTATPGATAVRVFGTTGHGTRRFPHAVTSHRVVLEMSCRGGHQVAARVGGRAWLTVYCGQGVAGGTSGTVRAPARLTVVASPGTRWSVVAAANG